MEDLEDLSVDTLDMFTVEQFDVTLPSSSSSLATKGGAGKLESTPGRAEDTLVKKKKFMIDDSSPAG